MKSHFAGLLGSVMLGIVGLMLLVLQTSMPGRAAGEDPLSPEPAVDVSQVMEGKASWYGPGFHGRTTASGAIFNRHALTAAHRTLRAGTVVRVTNLRNGRSTVLVVNDWGPVPADREIDVSEAAAHVLGFHHEGVAPVRIEVYRAADASE